MIGIQLFVAGYILTWSIAYHSQTEHIFLVQ